MKKFWTTLRWFILGGLVLVLLLMLTKPQPPASRIPGPLQKDLSRQFEQKLQHLEDAKVAGDAGQAEQFSPEEVNAALQDMVSNGQKAMGPGAAEDVEVRIVGINFIGNEAVGQFIVPRWGKDIYVTLAGRLGSREGYATLELTSAKVGNLSVPVSMINPRLQERLAEPSQRERLKLPDFIADVRVENGQLVIVEK